MRYVLASYFLLCSTLLPLGANAQLVPAETGHHGLWMSPEGGHGQPPAGTLPPAEPGHTGLWMAPNGGEGTQHPLYNQPLHRPGGEVVVSVAPPALRIDEPLARPDHGNPQWASGHWLWDGAGYQWNPGRWQEPPGRWNDVSCTAVETSPTRLDHEHRRMASGRGESSGTFERLPQPLGRMNLKAERPSLRHRDETPQDRS